MAQLLSTNVSGNLIVSQSANVAGNLIVSGYNVLNEIFQADNLTRVSANSGSTQSAVALNFVNTATVTVSVASGGAGVANIGFTSTATGGGTGTLNNFPVSVNTGSTVTANGINFVNSPSVSITVTQGISGNANISFTASPTSGVTQVATGLGLTGGPITSTGTISANIASTTVQGITKLIDSVTSTDTANAATGAAVKSAYDQGTAAYGQANLAYTQANTGTTTAQSAYNQANLAYTQANTGTTTAQAAYGQANLAYAAANTGLNKAQVSANGGSVQSNVGINFNNTASVLVSVSAGTTGNANVWFNVPLASPSVTGIVQLNDTVINNSTTMAPTANAVKATYDFAGVAYSLANAAYSAANTSGNTVQISANSGGTLSNKSLNFNNTATIGVNLGSGVGSNANISFDYIGSVSGGGSGINNFPVSANSGSTVTANGLNFVNSSSVNVSVSAGINGNANISFVSSNQFYTGLSTNPLTKIESSSRMLEWTHNRDYNVYPLPVGSGTASGVFAKPDGTKLFVVDATPDLIYQIPLSESWNLATAGAVTTYNFSAVEVTAADLSIKSDGSTLYLLGDGGNDITWFDMPTAWDVTSITAANSTFSVVSQTGTPSGLFIRPDGSKFWVCGGSNVYAYSMSTAWNMATASYDAISFSVNAQETSPQAISFSTDGKYMWIVGGTGDALYEYIVPTAWDISTAAFTGNFRNIRDTGTGQGFSFETAPTGIFVSTQNNRMYLVGTAEDAIIEYKTNEGVTVEAEVLAVTGKGSFNDDIWVRGDVFATEGVWGLDGIYAGTSGQFGLSAAGALTTSTLNAVVFNGSVNSTGNSAITIGTGIASTETNVAIGATLAGNTKNVRIGSGGTAGSLTNILIGPSGANATINVFANTTTFSNSVDIQGQLTVSGLNILNEIGIADNLTRVAANSGSILSNVALNFVNTSSVTVSVSSGEAGYANVAFTATAGGTGTVTQVDTGLGLTGGGFTTSGTISANIASTTVQGVTKLIDSVASTDAANAATGSSVKTAYDQATNAYTRANTANTTAVSAYGQANLAYTQANTGTTVAQSAYGQANLAYTQANTGTTVAQSAYGQANLAYTQANTGTNTAQAAYGQANLAYTAANTSGNTVQISANSGGTLSNKSLNFNNTATISVSVGAGAGSNANISFNYIGSVGGGSGINNFPVSANSGSTVTANGINFVNTKTVIVSVGAGLTGNAAVSFSVDTAKIIFVGTTAPSSPAIGDLWVDTN